MRQFVFITSLLLLALAGACRTQTVLQPSEPFTLSNEVVDASVATDLRSIAANATRDVEQFFGRPFARPFEVIVFPDRAAFDRSFPPAWGIEKTECWMVACGVADRLCILSPRVWREQACEHDPDDRAHVRALVAHELVHVFHGQSNPSGDFTGVEGLDWFVEGLAVHASGQLEQPHIATAADALEHGAGPKQLADAWTGKYRYGVSGSLVRYLDRRVGRETIVRMLAATTQAEALALAGMTESQLLEAWRARVVDEAALRR